MFEEIVADYDRAAGNRRVNIKVSSSDSELTKCMPWSNIVATSVGARATGTQDALKDERRWLPV